MEITSENPQKWFEPLDCSPCPLIILNEDGCIEDLNAAGCKLSSIPRNELIGSNIETSLGCIKINEEGQKINRDRKVITWQSLLEKTLNNGERLKSHGPIQLSLVDAESKATTTRHFLVDTTPLTIKGNAYVCLGLSDITEQALLKSSLHKATQIRENFLALINHELRTPLNPIRGYAELLLKDVEQVEQQAMAATIIQAANEELRLIEELIDLTELLSGYNQLCISEFKIVDLILIKFDSLTSNQEMNISMEYAFFNGAVDGKPIARDQSVRGDQLLIGKAIHYLLDSISRASASGRINMSVSINSSPEINPPWHDVLISVETNATNPIKLQTCPILNLNNLIAKKTTQPSTGFGLGIPITSEIARVLGGELLMKPKGENGSVITLKIPLEFATSPKEAKTAPFIRFKH